MNPITYTLTPKTYTLITYTLITYTLITYTLTPYALTYIIHTHIHTHTHTNTHMRTHTHRSGRLVGGEWAVEGCYRNDNLSNTMVTVCECNHLTHFAILLSPGPVVSSSHMLVMM